MPGGLRRILDLAGRFDDVDSSGSFAVRQFRVPNRLVEISGQIDERCRLRGLDPISRLQVGTCAMEHSHLPDHCDVIGRTMPEQDEVIRQLFGPVSEALIQEAEVVPGFSVLDVATGSGEPAAWQKSWARPLQLQASIRLWA